MITRLAVIATLLAATTIARADAPEEPTLPESDANPGATREQAVEAFVKDCHATLKATAFEYEEEKQVAECMALNVDQNCDPDIFGCYDTFDGCQRKCQPVCSKCQDTCATGCDDCKSACPAGDAACVRKCAEARADCRGRCMHGLRDCQGTECGRGADECQAQGMKRVKGCDSDTCDAYVACLDAQEDYEKAPKICAPKAKGLDAFCLGVCEHMHGIPIAEDDAAPASAPPIETGKALAAACTSESQCPKDYAAVAPYLASFCAGTTSEESLKVLTLEVGKGTIAKRTLGLVFNAYAAMYGYAFKKETWMNGFFYGAGGAWLPATCRAKMKTVASAKVMPYRLTRLRDQVKRIWDAAR